MNWNQPCCDRCWKQDHPNRIPVRVMPPETETCAFCGYATRSGIYVREHPGRVPYPAADDPGYEAGPG